MKLYKISTDYQLIMHLYKVFCSAVEKKKIVWSNSSWNINSEGVTNDIFSYYRYFNSAITNNNKINYIVYLSFVYRKMLLYQVEILLQAKTVKGIVNINNWVFNEDNPFPETDSGSGFGEKWKDFLLKHFNITGIEDPLLLNEKNNNFTKIRPVKIVKGKEVYFYTRLTRIKSSLSSASELEIVISANKFMTEYTVEYVKSDLEAGLLYDIQAYPQGSFADFSQARQFALYQVEKAKANGFVDQSSILYIPEYANSKTWDFSLNKWKNTDKPKDIQENENEVENENKYKPNLKDLFAQNTQNFEGYYNGQIPDYAAGLVGSSSVDASQINSMFGQTDKSIQLVNQFNSSLLKNIAFIFNFSKGGAYGVYLPELDKAIKTKALQKRLETQGYEIKEQNGLLTAYPTDKQKTSEQIDKDIDKLYGEIDQGGGTAMGINMNSVLSAARQDAAAMQSPDPNVWELLTVLHLGETIVHEATHSKGVMDEAGAEAVEMQFVNWALPKINDEYKQRLDSMGKGDEYSPIVSGTSRRHAKTNNWYKVAQYAFNFKSVKPYGSDLSGRNSDIKGLWQQGDWTMLSRQNADTPIEKRLGREFMAPLPKGLSQEHDSIELQLSKYRQGDPKISSDSGTELLLSEEHNDDASYHSMETLLEENRPYSLMTIINKKASKLFKKATLFGWYNNLSISDGSTIPGLSDRVMAWDDRDESFAEEEDWIEKQFRYNPTYDIKGMYYRWIEPRDQPQLFDDMTRDYSGTSPAKRFANKSEKIDPEIIKIINIINTAVSKIEEGSIRGTRLIATEDVISFIKRILDSKDIGLKMFRFDKTEQGEDIYSVWIYETNIPESNIDKAEMYFQDKNVSENRNEIEELIEDIFRYKVNNKLALQEIIDCVKNSCEEYGLNSIYVVGAYARQKNDKTDNSLINNLSFISELPDQLYKIGEIVTKKLGAIPINNGDYIYKEIRFDFGCSVDLSEIKTKMAELGIDNNNHLLTEICNRDFTVNMLIYNVVTEKVEDPIGIIQDIKDKVLRTFLDPSFVFENNPLIIVRALQLNKEGFQPEDSLRLAIILALPFLFKGESLQGMLHYVKENISEEDSHIREVLEQIGGNHADSNCFSK